MKTYQAIASALQALRTCEKKRTENPQHWGDMVEMHKARIADIVECYFPSGSGFDFRVSGKNRNEIKDFISDTFATVFNTEAQ